MLEGTTCRSQEIQNQRRLAELCHVYLLWEHRCDLLVLSSNRLLLNLSPDRCLSYDEKPLLLFQKLKDANKNPVFTLRHIKDIRSPIAVAQQKQASRSAARRDSPDASGTASGAATPAAKRGEQAYSSPNLPAYTRNTRLHLPPVLQPISARAAAATANAAAATPPLATANAAAPHWPEPNGQSNGTDGDRPKTNESSAAPPEGREGVVYATTKSYAIAIYPYLAELDDEFDVSV